MSNQLPLIHNILALKHDRLLLATVMLCVLFLNAAAQEKILNLKHFSAEQGLSDNQVTSVTRDRNGFIWIGTKDGLNRYDGHEFHVFKHHDKDTNSICANSITSLATDSDTILWIGTATSGLASYNFRTGRFRSFNKTKSGFPSNAINTIAFDKFRNRLWIGFNNGGLGYLSMEDYKYNIVDSSRSCYALMPVKDDIYVGAIAKSIYTLIRTVDTDSARIHNTSTINTIFIAKDSSMWVGAWNNAIHQLDLHLKYKKNHIFGKSGKLDNSGDEIYAINEDAAGTLWVGTKLSGLLLFDRNKNSLKYNFSFSVPVTSRVNAIYKDDFNRMWVATMSGLYLYDPAQNQFDITYLPVPENTVSCLIHGKCTTPGGTDIIAGDCGLFYKDKNSPNFTFKEMSYENSTLQITEIYRTSTNQIFVGTNKTLFELDTLNMTLHKMRRLVSYEKFSFFSIYASTINSIAEFRSSGRPVLIASIYGHILAIVDPETKDVGLPFKLQSLRKNDFLDNLIRNIYVDSKNRIWLCGVTRGIQQLIPKESVANDSLVRGNSVPEIKNWITYTDSKITLPVNNIFDMVENRDGTFWVTSQGSGLMQFNPESKTDQFKTIPSNYQSLQGIKKDGNDNLWIITASGILQYDPVKNRYKRFDRSHGIPIGVSGHFLEKSGISMAAGFNGGFVDFNPDSIIENSERPKVHITRLWIMDQPSDSLIGDQLTIPYNKNFIKLYVSANSFSFNDQTSFYYQLEGIDNTWRNNNNNPLITYTNLPAGNYNFKYKAINSDGIESEIKYYRINIIPPFYQTWWFFLISAVAVIVVVWLIYRYRINQLMRLQEVRNKIARDLHDDIGSTLGSIHLYSQVANAKIHKTGNTEIASILKKIEDGSQEIIGKTSDAIWVAKSEHDQTRDLIWKMENYCASLLGAAGIGFAIHHDPKIESLRLKMDQRKNLFLIFKEAIHNIIKYSKAGEVQITLSKNGNFLSLTISDNGTGFTASEMRSGGNGLNNMKQRAIDSGGSFEISSPLGLGTTIVVRFPIHTTQFW